MVSLLSWSMRSAGFGRGFLQVPLCKPGDYGEAWAPILFVLRERAARQASAQAPAAPVPIGRKRGALGTSDSPPAKQSLDPPGHGIVVTRTAGLVAEFPCVLSKILGPRLASWVLSPALSEISSVSQSQPRWDVGKSMINCSGVCLP